MVNININTIAVLVFLTFALMFEEGFSIVM